MDPKSAILAYIVVAGLSGMANRLYMAMFLRASESIQNPNGFKRCFWKYSTFSFSYLLSFFLTPALLVSAIDKIMPKVGGAPVYLLPALCVPLAILFYWLDCKQMIAAEARWKRAREPWWARSRR